MPARLRRDTLWVSDTGLPQLEFIVDSLTVARVLNIEASCENPVYQSTFDRMLLTLAALYGHEFQHKAGFFSSHDWRPREWNVTADKLCNIALDTKTNIHHRYIEDFSAYLQDGCSLQVYSDGGMREGSGAAAYAIFLVHPDEDFTIALAEVNAIYVPGARSAFEMEVVAADRAVAAVAGIKAVPEHH